MQSLYCFNLALFRVTVSIDVSALPLNEYTLWDVMAHWLSRIDCFQPEGRGLDSRSSRHVGTLGKSLTHSHSCMWRFGVKLRHSIRAVSGALLSRSGLEEAL